MKTSPKGIGFIKSFEGFSAKPYKDIAGIWTIGYGSTRFVKEDTPEITEEEGLALLEKDLVRFENSVNRLITVELKQNQFDALVSFAYNLGGGVLQYSSLRQKLNRGDFKGAADQFPRWVYARGRKNAGLLRRRLNEREMFLNG